MTNRTEVADRPAGNVQRGAGVVDEFEEFIGGKVRHAVVVGIARDGAGGIGIDFIENQIKQDLTLIGDAIEIGIQRETAGDITGIGNQVAITVIRENVTLIGDTVEVAIQAETTEDVTAVGDAIQVAIGFALIGNAVEVAVEGGSGGNVAHIADKVCVAVQLGGVEDGGAVVGGVRMAITIGIRAGGNTGTEGNAIDESSRRMNRSGSSRNAAMGNIECSCEVRIEVDRLVEDSGGIGHCGNNHTQTVLNGDGIAAIVEAEKTRGGRLDLGSAKEVGRGSSATEDNDGAARIDNREWWKHMTSGDCVIDEPSGNIKGHCPGIHKFDEFILTAVADSILICIAEDGVGIGIMQDFINDQART